MILNMVLAGETSTSRLPKEYQEVEYIQSSGTQYIDTGYYATQNTRVVAAMEYVTFSNATCGLFGAGKDGASYNFECYNYNSKYTFRCGSVQGTVNGSAVTGSKMIIDFSKNSATWDVGGTVYNVTPSSVGTFTGPYTMFIHGLNRNGVAYRSVSKTYYFQIYDNGTLVREFIPCYRKSDTAIGLYDIANDVFYTNAGTGTFTKGADVSGGGSSSESLEFTYSGNYTDNRVNGIGTVRLNTSGTLTVTGKAVTVTATIVGAGGGAARSAMHATSAMATAASGGGGGTQTVEVTLEPGIYDVVIGTGGAYANGTGAQTGGTGGDTTVFGATSTGGKGAYASYSTPTNYTSTPGVGGTPNGVAGGGNGGNLSVGGDGYVELTSL